MMDDDQAVAIMGNHELNAILYHTKGKNSDGSADGYMRSHSDKNYEQHQTFLAEPLGDPQTQKILDWFLDLPLFLELDGLRLIHACWDQALVDQVLERLPDGKLKREDLQDVALENSATPFCHAVTTLLKGPEVRLPDGYSFLDKNGIRRTHVRVKWWASSGAKWADVALSVQDTGSLPDEAFSLEADIEFYASDAPPVFFGHYKRDGAQIKPDAHNVMCLDYPETPCAYRWNGEAILDRSSLISRMRMTR